MKKLSLIASVVLLVGCSWDDRVRYYATDDFPCPKDRIHVSGNWASGVLRARGCGKQARYRCANSTCQLAGPVEPAQDTAPGEEWRAN